MKKKQVIFIQGFNDYSDRVWPKWMESEFTKAGFDFNFLPMPDVMFPEVDKWVDFLDKQNFKLDSNTYLVAHSLGCITVARYFEKLLNRSKAQACIFIAGFCTIPKLPLLFGFCAKPVDYSKVKKHAKEFIMVISDNDRLIPNSDSLEMAKNVGARVITEHNQGHFTNVKKIPTVVNTILEIEQMKEEVKEMKKLRRK